MKLDFTKPIRTRDGREARIYARDGGGRYPLHGAYYDTEDECWFLEQWTACGQVYASISSGEDLVNYDEPPTEVEIFVNVYVGGEPCAHETRAEADRWASDARVACKHLKFTYTQGEGLKDANTQ